MTETTQSVFDLLTTTFENLSLVIPTDPSTILLNWLQTL